MFKVGDKVVRKNGNKDAWWMHTKPEGETFTVSLVYSYHTIQLTGSNSYYSVEKFDLYVEPVAGPKFKVGDTVWAKDTKLQILGVSFLYRTNNGSFQYVHEDKLSATPPEPPKPREITVDGVVYREVL